LASSSSIYIPQPLHAYTATLCIRLAGDISLETKRQPSKRSRAVQTRSSAIHFENGWHLEKCSEKFWTKMCVVVRVPFATGNIQQVELRLWKEEKQSSMDETEIPPHQV